MSCVPEYPSRASFVQGLVCTVYVKLKDSNIPKMHHLGRRELVCVLLVHFCLFCSCCFLAFFSSSWCRGLAAVCDCIPWIFLLTFYGVQKVCSVPIPTIAQLCMVYNILGPIY